MFKIGQEGQQVSVPNNGLTNDDEMNREVQSVRTSPPSVLPIDTLHVRIFNKSTNFSVNHIFRRPQNSNNFYILWQLV